MSEQSRSDTGLLIVVCLVAAFAWSRYDEQANHARPADPPGVSLSPVGDGGLSEFRQRDAKLAHRLGAILGACGDMVERDRDTITSTDHVLRLAERAEHLGTTEEDAGKLPGLGAAITARLTAPGVLGGAQGVLTPERRAAAARELRAIGLELRGRS